LTVVACNADAPQPWVLEGVPQLSWEQYASPGRLLVGWLGGWRYAGEVEYEWGPARYCAPDYAHGETIEVCYGEHAWEPALRFGSPEPGQLVEMAVRSVWVDVATLLVSVSVEAGPVSFCQQGYWWCDGAGCAWVVAAWP
jgi:hypothetical protein